MVAVMLRWEMHAGGCGVVRYEDAYTLNNEGLHIQSRLKADGDCSLVYSVPYFVSNGKDHGAARLSRRLIIDASGMALAFAVKAHTPSASIAPGEA